MLNGKYDYKNVNYYFWNLFEIVSFYFISIDYLIYFKNFILKYHYIILHDVKRFRLTLHCLLSIYICDIKKEQDSLDCTLLVEQKSLRSVSGGIGWIIPRGHREDPHCEAPGTLIILEESWKSWPKEPIKPSWFLASWFALDLTKERVARW